MKRSLSSYAYLKIINYYTYFMNKFEKSFFSKYVPEWQEIQWVLHSHFVNIFNKLFLWLTLWVIIPSFLYYYSIRLQELVPFFVLEWLLIIVFIRIIYNIFNWYNDVWIVTTLWVIQLDRAFFKTNTKSVEFEKIEWIEVQQSWIIDKILKKWDLIIHKIWDDTFLLANSMNPYLWIDFIEEISQENEVIKETHNEHYDLIMDALWWVVENYLEKKLEKTDKETEAEKIVEEAKVKKGTLDLR